MVKRCPYLAFLSVIFSLVILCSACVKKDTRTVIKFSSWGSESEVAIIKPILHEFEDENPDIKIEFIHIPKNYFQKIHLLIASNLAPDVIFLNNLNGPVYAENNILENLSPYLKKDDLLSENDFFDKSLNALSYKNQLYAVPRDISNLVIYYNKDLFEKYNVPYPSKNWIFADFENTARRLTHDFNKDGKPELFGVSFEEMPLFWTPFLWSNGGGILSTDLREVIISTPESIEALQFYADLRNSLHVAPSADEQGSATMPQMFMQSKIAMLISGRWNVPKFRKELEFDWDIARFPAGKAGSVVDADASGWAIVKTSKHKNEAWRLIRFLASKPSSENFTRSGLIVPARRDVALSDTFLNRGAKPNSAAIFTDIIPKSVPTPANKNYREITDIITSEFEPLWRGKKSAKEVVNDKLVSKIKNLL